MIIANYNHVKFFSFKKELESEDSNINFGCNEAEDYTEISRCDPVVTDVNNYQPSDVNNQPSDVNNQPSDINNQPFVSESIFLTEAWEDVFTKRYLASSLLGIKLQAILS